MYLSKHELLSALNDSKMTYCSFVSGEYARYDAIVRDVAEVALHPEGSVVRVMCEAHIPEDPEGRRRRNGSTRMRTNFPPFRHYLVRDGQAVEVGRSHWQGGLSNGWFSADHGRTTDALARAYVALVNGYGRRGNWRNYSWLDDMKGAALLQLASVGLQYDESRSDNAFAYLTMIVSNVFKRHIGVERRQRDIRDELLVAAGAAPSHARQVGVAILREG